MSNSSMNIHGVTSISAKPSFLLNTGTRVQHIAFRQADGSEFEVVAFFEECAPELVASHPPGCEFF